MNNLSLRFISAALILQINVAFGLLGSVTNITNILNLPAGVELLKCVNIKNYPTISEDIARYNDQQRQKTIPECCEPDEFPGLFQLTHGFFSCIENIFISLGGGLCDLVKLLSPLGCRQEIEKDLSRMSSVGCVLKSLLGSMLGEIGASFGEIAVTILGPIEYSTGCLVSGTAQIYNKVVEKRTDDRFGKAVGPMQLGSIILATPFILLSCFGEPMVSFVTAARDAGMVMIMERCLDFQKDEGIVHPDI